MKNAYSKGYSTTIYNYSSLLAEDNEKFYQAKFFEGIGGSNIETNSLETGGSLKVVILSRMRTSFLIMLKIDMKVPLKEAFGN